MNIRHTLRFSRLVGAALLTGMVGVLSSAAHAQFTLYNLPTASGFLGTTLTGISGDGAKVVGYSFGGPADQGMVWTPSTGVTTVPHASGVVRTRIFDISADGNTQVGEYQATNFFEHAYRQVGSGTPTSLGNMGYPLAGAQAASADGAVVVGVSCTDQFMPQRAPMAFRWTQATGMVNLGDFAGGQVYSVAQDVSADGSVVVGISDASWVQSFRWTQATGMVKIASLNPASLTSGGDARGVSADGNVVVGLSTSTLTSHVEAYRWSPGTGTVGLGLLASMGSDSQSFAQDVSGDGNAIVGGASTSNNSINVATLWNPHIGLVDLKSFLMANYGASLPANFSQWHFDEALLISADGTTIAGRGNFGSTSSNWVLRYEGGFQNIGGSTAVPEAGSLMLIAPVVLAFAGGVVLRRWLAPSISK